MEPDYKSHFRDTPSRELDVQERWWLQHYPDPANYQPIDWKDQSWKRDAQPATDAPKGRLPYGWQPAPARELKPALSFEPRASLEEEWRKKWRAEQAEKEAHTAYLTQQLDLRDVPHTTGELDWDQIEYMCQRPLVHWQTGELIGTGEVFGRLALGYSGTPVTEHPDYYNYSQLNWAMYFVEEGLLTDGSHHKQWALNQAAQVLQGTLVTGDCYQFYNKGGVLWSEPRPWLQQPPSDCYARWRQQLEDDDYTFDDGIAP